MEMDGILQGRLLGSVIMISWYAVVIWSSLALVLGIPIIQSIKHERRKREMKRLEDLK